LSFFSDTTNEWMVGGFCQMWMVKVGAIPMKNPAVKRGSFAWNHRRETGHPGKGWKAGEAIRTPDIHVGNVQAHRRGAINRVDFLR
jgi:hypothetical protein